MEIEIVSVGVDQYSPIEEVIGTLNRIQGEFHYQACPSPLRADGLALVRERYTSDEVFDFLQAYKQKRGAGCDFVVGFVGALLDGTKYKNIFGNVNAPEHIAVASTFVSSRYTRDVRRFCAYFLLRYVYSFIAPAVKSHNRETDKDCYLHRKVHRPDLLLSMDSGRVCDDCRRQMQLTSGQWAAAGAIADFIRGEHPHALIMKGGGVKGLAFTGAMEELEKHFSFDTYVGTSAGAIAAVMFATGYTAAEVQRELRNKDFTDFLDTWKILWLPKLLVGRACNSGDQFKAWVDAKIRDKVSRQADVTLRDISPARVVLYASSPNRGTFVFDSSDQRRDTVAAFAVRCSMSIPFLFETQLIEGAPVYDGGLRHNFPVATFVSSNPRKLFVGLFLQAPPREKRRWLRLLDLYDIWMNQDERDLVDARREDMVLVDPGPIGTIDFNLSEDEKVLLIEAGRLGAQEFAVRRKLDSAPAADRVAELRSRVEDLRARVIHARVRRRQLKWFVIVALVALLVIGRWLQP